jgi:putative CocE/NonD family hydrolase
MIKKALLIVAISMFFVCCSKTEKELLTESLTFVQENYTKKEVTIAMRDGVKLFTSIYSPLDTTKTYPILIQRTPYSCAPYGSDKYKEKIGPNDHLMKDGYIIVYQDVRGRWMSEGIYDNMRAYLPNKKSETDIDESSDTFDTIDWLVKNINNNNGKVGIWGISYPGFYSTYATLDAHPALVAASPQACIGDFFFDDFHHNGAYLLSYFRATSLFGTIKDTPTDSAWYSMPDLKTKDQYQFFLDAGPLKNLNHFFQYETPDQAAMQGKEKIDDVFWKELTEHPNYDSVWQSKGIIQHLKNIKPHVATMVVGGLFDAEDLYGPLETYKTIELNNPNNYNTLVFGPWDHGGWSRTNVENKVGNYYFGDSISLNFQKNIEAKFFDHFLKGTGSKETGLPEAYVFDSGKKVWSNFASWPPSNISEKRFYLNVGNKLSENIPALKGVKFFSDLTKPVPYSEDIKTVFTPRKYMTDDQRFAARRPDVLIYETDVLTDDFTIIGDIKADLKVATTGTDADWVVKIIDVHPPDAEEFEGMQDHLKMSNYHLMVRSEVMRGKFRDSFSHPKPFVPNQTTSVQIKLQDVFHTFKKGHKLQIQVQSTWFPLIDLNPQTFVDNIYQADEEDFVNQTHTVFTSSSILFNTVNK